MYKKKGVAGMMSLIILLIVSAFVLLSFRDATFDIQTLAIGAVFILMLMIHFGILTRTLPDMDRHILVIVYVLLAIGMIMQCRINTEYALRQLIWIGVGMLAMIVTVIVMRFHGFFQKMIWPIMVLSIGLLLAVLIFGKETAGAKNWIGPEAFRFQPSEFIKVVLIFVLATWLAREQRVFVLWPMWGYAIIMLGLLVLSRDLGGAAIYGVTTLVLFFTATGNLLVTSIGIGAGAAGFMAAYHLFSHVRVRVAVWRNPWTKYGEVGGGYQIAQGLMAIASGGLFGMGLGQGMPKSIPAYRTDYIFAVICEEMGILVGVCIIALFLLIILRGISIARQSNDRFQALLSIGVVTIFGIQSFLIIGGVVKLIPLTGVTLPFVSYGGSSMIASFILMGMLAYSSIQNKK